MGNLNVGLTSPCRFCGGEMKEEWHEYMDGWLYMGSGGKCGCGRTEYEEYAGSAYRMEDGEYVSFESHDKVPKEATA